MGATPQRAMIAGSPQARTASEEDEVARSDCPPTVLGQWDAADRQGADPELAGATTSMDDEHADSTPIKAIVPIRGAAFRRAQPCT